jgi:hypothetical protein
MNKFKIVVLIILFSSTKISAQSLFGSNNYIEYSIGNLPIVISVPHGGYLQPSNIPNRTCNNAVNVSDANTIELAKSIDSSFYFLTGCRPHIIYCNLHRAKLDCNRNLLDGACNNQQAEISWNEFHSFIDTAQTLAKNAFDGKAFYIDLHGHGNPIQRLELGYLLYDNELSLPDSTINTNQFINYSSIKNLVTNNTNSLSHSQLLRGSYSLGTLFGNAGYPAVPSTQIPSPGTTSNYYSGGYNIANHTSYLNNNTVNGLQIECNFNNVRDNYLNRKSFADSLAMVVLYYLNFHQNLNFTNCNLSGIVTQNKCSDFSIINNVIKLYEDIYIHKISPIMHSYSISDNQGRIILNGKIDNSNSIKTDKIRNSGIYYLSITNKEYSKNFKLLIIE